MTRHLAIVGRFPLFPDFSRTIVVSIASLYLIEKSILPFGGTFLAFSITIVSILLERNVLILVRKKIFFLVLDVISQR